MGGDPIASSGGHDLVEGQLATYCPLDRTTSARSASWLPGREAEDLRRPVQSGPALWAGVARGALLATRHCAVSFVPPDGL